MTIEEFKKLSIIEKKNEIKKLSRELIQYLQEHGENEEYQRMTIHQKAIWESLTPIEQLFLEFKPDFDIVKNEALLSQKNTLIEQLNNIEIYLNPVRRQDSSYTIHLVSERTYEITEIPSKPSYPYQITASFDKNNNMQYIEISSYTQKNIYRFQNNQKTEQIKENSNGKDTYSYQHTGNLPGNNSIIFQITSNVREKVYSQDYDSEYTVRTIKDAVFYDKDGNKIDFETFRMQNPDYDFSFYDEAEIMQIENMSKDTPEKGKNMSVLLERAKKFTESDRIDNIDKGTPVKPAPGGEAL